MQFNHTLSAILRGHWCLDKAWADAHIPMVVSMLNGIPVSFIERSGNESIEMPFVINPATMTRTRFAGNPNIPENSVGIIPMSGVMTKYNGDCGEPGSIARNTWLMDMEKRDNIGSVVLLMDTPGGESRAAHTLTQTIEKFKKPVLSYIDGMAASLGVWYTSATDEVYLGNEMFQIGSVGSYVTLLDFSEYLEMNGIKVRDIYAPQSNDKNKGHRDALAGDTAAIEADLEIHVDAFIRSIKNNRGDKAIAYEKEWSTGKMFYAKDAVKVGLADGIKSFDQVVSKAAWLAKRKN